MNYCEEHEHDNTDCMVVYEDRGNYSKCPVCLQVEELKDEVKELNEANETLDSDNDDLIEEVESLKEKIGIWVESARGNDLIVKDLEAKIKELQYDLERKAG